MEIGVTGKIEKMEMENMFVDFNTQKAIMMEKLE